MCLNCYCEYEWGVYVVVFGVVVDLMEEQVVVIWWVVFFVLCWNEWELLLFEIVDGLCFIGKFGDDVLFDLCLMWIVEQQFEIFVLCGIYQMISYVVNYVDMDFEVFVVQFFVFEGL